MVNYGYRCIGWSNEAKKLLAFALTKLCSDYPDAYKMFPYVEADLDKDLTLYEGVRIRRITHLTEQQQTELVTKADEIKLAIGKKFGYKD